jgi:uncharacterized protein
MPIRRLLSLGLLALGVIAPSRSLQAQSVPAAITSDPAQDQNHDQDKANRAAMQSFQIPSHGALLNALVYVAAGAQPHPIVILLHGFPGNEKNLDLAQSIRRANYDVLYFDYRGSWGSPGDFSFTHSIEDTDAAIAYLRDPSNARRLRADPANIILIGHSMGGMIAANVAAHDPAIRGLGLISAANMGGMALGISSLKPEQQAAPIQSVARSLAAEGMAPLAGCTPESLARDLVAHAAEWNLPSLAPRLASRPILIITSDDGLAPGSDALAASLEKLGNTEVKAIHMATDHSYSDHRIELQKAVLEGLAYLPTQTSPGRHPTNQTP